MRKAIILGLAGVFLTSAAMACQGGMRSATSAVQQTAMSDDGSHDTKSATKPEPKG